MRQAFKNQLYKKMKANKNVMLLTADLGFMLFEEIRDEMKEQFINVGVAEANMMGVASGLAMGGKIVFAYSIATFATYRTFEQIRNDISQHNLPVVVVGTGSGLSYSDAGPSHHGLEDIGILRTIPNLLIFSPSDPLETAWCVNETIKLKRPAYIRLGKNNPTINSPSTYFKFTEPNVIKNGKDFIIFTTGSVIDSVMEADTILRKKGVKGTIVSTPTLKPVNKKSFEKLIKNHKYIFSAEEHNVIGGLGSLLSEIISESETKHLVFKRFGIPDTFISIAGSQDYLRTKFGLSPQQIATSIIKSI